jgi:hypothetical protein
MLMKADTLAFAETVTAALRRLKQHLLTFLQYGATSVVMKHFTNR